MKTSLKFFTLCMLIALISSLAAMGQTTPPAPSTDIYLIEIAKQNGKMKLGEPVNITNRTGYDNQPSFLPDGRSFLYTSIREDKQADIYQYDIAKKSTSRITSTAESEYSPTLMPDGKHISVIRVEADQTQRLWKFPLAAGTPSLILESIKPVGYHVWADEHTLLLFVLGQPSTLQLVDARNEKAEALAEDIGRTLLRVPGQEKLSFAHKVSADQWMIKTFDKKTRQIAALTKTLPGNEYYAWTPEGILIMGKGSKLFWWDPAKGGEWQEVADFSGYGLKEITRLAVSPKGDHLAVVAQDQPVR